jgi:ubiquinone/menaquinone biosynthesis C-methylase UbiE
MTTFWDEYAATYDEEPDHGLRDPAVRTAWTALLLPLLPPAPATVADLGCGTGTLAVLLAEEGHHVRGLDLSGDMLAAAARKAALAGTTIELRQGDVSFPPYPAASCDVVLARHILWALPDPDAALARWVALLAPGGRLVLVEGRWSTGGGLTSTECQELVRHHRQEATVTRLTDPALWGRAIDDERYLVVSRH